MRDVSEIVERGGVYGALNRIEGRFQRLETDPLPCTKSVLQSHSADVATANNFR
jgi:hypothetical protein